MSSGGAVEPSAWLGWPQISLLGRPCRRGLSEKYFLMRPAMRSCCLTEQCISSDRQIGSVVLQKAVSAMPLSTSCTRIFDVSVKPW